MPAGAPGAAWLRLTLIPGIGGETQRKLLAAFGLPENIFSASRSSLRGVIGDKATDRLLETDNRATVEAAQHWAEQPGQRILTLADNDYPRTLLDIADPPTLLYVRGRSELLSLPAIAIVGSRNATPQGESNARAFATALAAEGLSIVSGLALGIDAAAHRGAMAAGGATIAVIGTGADRLYPARNQALACDIAKNGAIISEFPLGTPAAAANFPRRNRLISGLSRGVLVVEAAVESGSLITARMAGEQGREVFAIPGSIHSPQSRGCHRLIRQGAKLVETAQDVMEELGVHIQAAPAVSPPTGASDEQSLRILTLAGFDPVTIDDLVARSGLTADALSVILLQLELDRRVSCLPGGRYQRLAE
ncbi:MAG: DNA-protecting protein DprA [Betaproteobacteria bacterium]|uniref:DNA-protecting protein DprA n=1 Tax=Candidatus Proximibacter danicus TaxID=2954365 RepID=A0A9D7K2Y4_9PROT|nr:DNA-protecting protein DprA [Candidatus Proximibacter danicus]MBK9447209.1 DNA-protecting protein DprA [Betaproteobacteria bacterium]